MTTLSDSELAAIIGPVETRISEAVLYAWSTWLETPNKKYFCARTRANMIWDIATRTLEEKLDPLPSIHVNRSSNTCMFMIGQQLTFRFKKADENGVSSNYPTPMALAFHDPEQYVLGIPEAVKTEIVYVLNKLETEISTIKLVRRNGDTVAWSHPIYDRNLAKVFAINTTEHTQKVTPRKARASIKREIAEKLATALDKSTPKNVTPSK
ncbi:MULTISPECIES: hypothetical protein [unclassified Pseudomonas]|uniref:hypothetical protein n=1 Tax=unclassified Pseudomonas TaxID=196821 RepID=UPI002E81215A|nr:hypothetical protein [Pseudomonas sp. 10C3]MEE3507778.1 hypothetical protein [Pseudomonas sp. 10C3]